MTSRIGVLSLAAFSAATSAGASCSTGGSRQVTMDPPVRVGAPAWKVDVDAVGGPAGFSFAEIDEVAATRADRPVIVAGAQLATDAPHVQATFDGVGHSGGEVIGIVERPDGWTIRTLGGERYEIAQPAQTITGRWYDLAPAPGVLGVIRGAAGVTLARYQGGAAQAVWSRSIAGAIADAQVFGWLGDDVIVGTEGNGALALSKLHLADGAVTPIATIPGRLGRVAVSARAARLAAVTLDEKPDGSATIHVEIRELGGRSVKTLELPSPDDAVYPFGDGVTMGFDGRALWFYSYRPEHDNDVLGTKSPETCGYDVYDTDAGKRVRTLAQARGDWARLSGSCRVHALLATQDGGAIAFAVGGDRKAEVVKFDGPP